MASGADGRDGHQGAAHRVGAEVCARAGDLGATPSVAPPRRDLTPRATSPQATAKLEALELQLASAESEGKAKRAEKLSAARAELTSRIELVRGSRPISRPARHAEEMQALRKRIAELDKLEKSSKILPLADVEKIAARPRLREELAALEADAAGWFTS